jgi:hypothetical protein
VLLVLIWHTLWWLIPSNIWAVVWDALKSIKQLLFCLVGFAITMSVLFAKRCKKIVSPFVMFA